MEGAARVFAGEFNASTLQVRGDGAGDPPWIVTPCGAWCRRMYIVGALTETTGSGDMIRCRVADPTGAFEIVTGDRKTRLSDVIRNLPVPSFISLIGEARMYRTGEKVTLSVRPDEVRIVDRSVRDQWVLQTAESTLKRLEALQCALQHQPPGERVIAAIRHYEMTPLKLGGFGRMVGEAVQSIKPLEDAIPAPGFPECRDTVLGIVKEAGGPRGVAIDAVIAQAATLGVSKEAVLAILESLIKDDDCYQPQKGFVKVL